MDPATSVFLDAFCSGHLIVDHQRNIVFCNQYMIELSGIDKDKIIGSPLVTHITPASKIFLESYIYPILLSDSDVQECQITWLTLKGDKVPVIGNVKLSEDGSTYWSIFVCVNHDKLYSELLEVKSRLEDNAKELLQLATKDPLTSLINRRELCNRADRVISQAAREVSSFAVLMIDVDNFKQVNDTYGHQVGDGVLQHVARLLLEDRREHDLVSRFGGEEFVVLLPGIDETFAFNIAEKLRKKIEATPKDKVAVTVSIGLTIGGLSADGNFDHYLGFADKALYESKNNGRNKTSVATAF